MTDDGAGLRSEMAAFAGGFGHPESIRLAFLDALLWVPTTDDGRFCTSKVEGIAWLCAFTEEREYARYVVGRGVVADREYRFHRLLGRRLIAYAEDCSQPTGVVVDCAGATPFAFPPKVVPASAGVSGE
ncbi:hypothetical protein ACIP5Y_42500 [Nocardia sp. NPDC088792]|uniref:hypothetical protein n=1 Tax=Nocardia sp. NPDC088792 TaxID=3364332 RepID=UPI003809DB06